MVISIYLAAMIGFFLFITQYLQDGLGFTALQAGLGFLPMTLVNFVVAKTIPQLNRWVLMPALLLGGTALTPAGMLWLPLEVSAPDRRTRIG